MNEYEFPDAADLMKIDGIGSGQYEPTSIRDLNSLSWYDGRAWSESDWVYFPASTNVNSARYCADGSFRFQVLFGGKIKHSAKRGVFYDPTRLYEYGPWPGLTFDKWFEFLLSGSKGHWSWANLDVRWGSPIPFRQLY
jgi:hypothetical protein